MPASPNLFKVLTAEDPKSLLEDEIGCMTGIFQIFDRSQAFTGRRYGSKRVTSAADQSLSVSACESPRHDRSSSNPYWMKVDNNLEQSKGAVDHQSRDHHRAYSDSSDIFTKSFKAQGGGGGGVLDRHLTDQKDHDQFAEQELSNSQEEEGEEHHVPTLVCSNSSQEEEEEEEEEEESNNSNRLMKSVQDLVVDRSSSSVPHSKEYPKPSPILMVSSREMCAAAAIPEGRGGSSRQHCNSKDVQKLPSSLDIRDVVRASFHRERPRDSSGKEKPRASVDLGHGSSSSTTNVQSKSLPRSSSVNGRVDGFRMSVDGREELLWSSSASAVDHARSTGGRGSRMLVGDWKNGLRNSSTVESTPPQLSAALREKDNIQSSSKACVDGGRELPRISVDRNCFTKRSSCPAIDGRDHAAAATRLTVELKEDPRLSVSKDERQGGVFVDARDHHQYYSSPRLLLPGLNPTTTTTTTTVRYPHESKDPSTTTTTTAAAFDFRESLRAADFKDLLRASQIARGTTTDAPRFSVDGTRDPPHVHLSPRLSVDGRDSPRACRIPPRLKLDGRDATRAHGKLSSRSDGGGGAAAAFLQLKKENNAAERDHQGQGEACRRIPNVVARLMGLEELPSSDPGSQAHPAKFADYHTLVNPPPPPPPPPPSSSSRSEARLLQGLLQYTPATVVSPPLPPPPSQSDDYNYKQQQVVVREGFEQLSSKSSSCSNQKEMRVPLPSHLHHLHYYGGEEEEEIPLQYPPPLEERFWIHHAQEKSRDHPEVKSPTHHQVRYHPHDEAFQEEQWQHLSSQTPAPQLSDHVVLTALKHTDEEKTTQPLSEEEPLCGLMDQEMHQLRLKNSVQGRKLLRHILHAMQLKGLLHHPPGRNRKQSSEDVKAAAAATQQQQQLQVPKATTVEESKSRMQALKQQFLPSPRLTIGAVRKRGNSLVPAETCKDNKDNKKTVATQQQDQQHHLPMMMTMETNLLQELVVNSSNEERINSCCSVQQDDGPIMLGNIPDTLIIVPKPITEMEDDNIITTAITTLSSSSPQTGDLDCISSQSSSSARSAVTSSVQTSTETEYPQSSSTCSNGTVATMISKRENGDAAAANGRTSRVQTQSSSGSSSLREPNGSSSSDTEAVTVVTPRMSRKERIAARSSKSSQLDAAAAASQGGGRDVSPARSPRLLTSSPLAQVGKPRPTFLIKEANPLKPGLLSPGRCAGGGSSSSGLPQLVESSGSKASSWSTKSFTVKDREETKATLFTLRAQSTKQEFLKGRASGGPDTPRPLRRSSSDSKLISRMTEKLTATDAAVAAAVSTRTAAAQAGGAQGGRILIPAEVTISRSKRKTGKPNNPTPKCRTSSSSSSSSPSSCAVDTTTETLVSAAAADPSTKEKINKFPNGVTGPAVMAVAADEHTNWDQSNDSDLMMLESIQCANIALAESRLLELPTATIVMPENLVTTSKNVSSVRKALRVTSVEKLELLQATSIQKPSMPIAVEDTVNHGEEDGGGDSHACLASKQVTSSPIERLCKSEQLDAELDERGSSISEVLTPRGVSVKKTYKFGHELGPADQLVEQPSPVSVLDNFHFQEEDLTPSPSKTSSSTLDSLQDAFDESLHRDHLEEAKAALKGLADIQSRDLCNQQQDYLCYNNKQSVEIEVPIDSAQQAGTHYSLAGNNNTVVHGICLWSKDEEREYVRDMLVASRVITEDNDNDDTSSSGINNCRLQWGRSSGYNNIMDVNQFDDLEARWRRRQQQQASSFNNTKENDFFLFERRQTCLENEAVGRRVLFDGTNEILVQKLDHVKFNPLPWIGGCDRPQPQEKPSGQQLIQQVWDELQDVPCVASEDVCDTIYTILHKDLRNTEKKWSDMDGEVSEVSLDLERMIVKDLIDEIVKDLTVQATTTTTTTTTTQLIDEAAAAATR